VWKEIAGLFLVDIVTMNSPNPEGEKKGVFREEHPFS
jgi:hypothetical protein